MVTRSWVINWKAIWDGLELESKMKRIKYEIRFGEPNKPMSTGPKKVEPILCVGPLTERRPRLAHQVSDS